MLAGEFPALIAADHTWFLSQGGYVVDMGRVHMAGRHGRQSCFIAKRATSRRALATIPTLNLSKRRAPTATQQNKDIQRVRAQQNKDKLL